jgi:hypothetical protein
MWKRRNLGSRKRRREKKEKEEKSVYGQATGWTAEGSEFSR